MRPSAVHLLLAWASISSVCGFGTISVPTTSPTPRPPSQSTESATSNHTAVAYVTKYGVALSSPDYFHELMASRELRSGNNTNETTCVILPNTTACVVTTFVFEIEFYRTFPIFLLICYTNRFLKSFCFIIYTSWADRINIAIIIFVLWINLGVTIYLRS